MSYNAFGVRVLTVADIERAAPAVQWHLRELAEEWGRVKDAEAWAVPIVREALERVVGKVSAGVLHALGGAAEGLPEEERFQVIVYESKAAADAARASDPLALAWRWPWECDEGATLCRASAFVLEEVERIWPSWDRLGEAREKLTEAGPSAWDDGDDGEPALALRVLTWPVAAKWYRDTRVEALPVETANGISQVTIAKTIWKPDGKVFVVDPESAEHASRDALARMGTVVPAVDGRVDFWCVQEAAGAAFARMAELAGVLSVHLAHTVMRQWRAGVPHPDNVFLPASRDGMTREVGRTVDPEAVREALEWLMDIRVYGWPLVNGFDQLGKHPDRVASKGRSTPYFRVVVGEGLHPWHGVKACLERGFTIPHRMRFLSPVLPLSEVPLFGDSRTHDRQRVAFAYLIGAVMVEHREQYIDVGGIEESLLRSALRQRGGFYVRSHADMPARAIQHYLSTPAQLSLDGNRGPVLQRFSKRLGGKHTSMLKLGPGYSAEEALIEGAAATTKRQRKRAQGRWSGK